MSEQKYTWVPLYEELARILLQYKDSTSRKHLVSVLNDINNDFGNKYGSDGPRRFSDSGEIRDIDPFTIFTYINSWGLSKKRILLEQISTALNLSTPRLDDEEFKGVPNANSQKFCFFEFNEDGIGKTIPISPRIFFHLNGICFI